jgi:hypothetical protein
MLVDFAHEHRQLAFAEALAGEFGVAVRPRRPDVAQEVDVVLADEALRFAPAIGVSFDVRRWPGIALRFLDVVVDQPRGDGEDETAERDDGRPAKGLQPGTPAGRRRRGFRAPQFDLAGESRAPDKRGPPLF